MQELERGGASPETQLDASIGLRRLAESGILVRHRGGRVGFRHALLRDTVYQSVARRQREAIHRAAYDYYRRQDRLADGVRLPQMAFHAARSGLKEEAGRLYLDLAARRSRAARLPRRRDAVQERDREHRRRRSDVPRGGDPGAGRVRYRLGRHDDAIGDYDAALGLARQVGATAAQIDVLLDEGIVLDLAREWPRAAAVTEEAAALIAADPTLDTPVVEARLLMSRGRSFTRGDKMAEAHETFARAIAAAEPLGEEAYDAYTTSMSLGGYVTATLGKYDVAEEWTSRVLKVYEEHGDIFGIATTLINRGTLWFLTGRFDRLIAELERSVALSREYGMTLLESLCVRDLGEIYLSLGKPVEGERYIQRAHAMYVRSMGENAARAVSCELQLARLKWWSGDVAAAQEIFQRASAQQAVAQASGPSDAVLTGSERLMLDQVGVAVGAGSAAEFDALIARGHELALQPQDIVELIEWKGLAALRAGRRLEAIPLFEEALTMAEQKAPLVTDRVRAQLMAARADDAGPVTMKA